MKKLLELQAALCDHTSMNKGKVSPVVLAYLRDIASTGGKSRSKAKQDAARINALLARKAKQTKGKL